MKVSQLTRLVVLGLAVTAAIIALAAAFRSAPAVAYEYGHAADLHAHHAGSAQQTEANTNPASSQWYSTQLHMHAWSNHNAGNQPGSLQLHSQWGQGAGMDVFWWQEHNPTFHQVNDFQIGLADATVDPVTLAVAIPLPPGIPPWAVFDYVTQFVPSFAGQGTPSATLTQGLLRMQMVGNGDAVSDRFRYEARTTGGSKLGGLSFTRPLASDPVFSFDAARCDSSGSQAYAQVEVDLSWHNYGTAHQQRLVYRLVPANQPANIVHSSSVVTVTVPLTSTRVNLPLLAHALLLPDGDDNSIQGLHLAVGATGHATGCMEIGNFNFHSRVATPAELFQRHKEVAQRHQATYGITQHTSWEQFAGLRHLNPFLPSSATLLPGLFDIQVQQFVPLIHSHNGLVGLNHPFGVAGGPILPQAEQEARLQGFLDVMLPVQAWNVDLIEIYKHRGQTDLYHHLRLWDLLAVNGVDLCANAASDQHGGMFWNVAYMSSWIEAPSMAQDDLLDGLRRCRVSFGDLSRFDGVLDLRLDSVPMGGTHPVRSGTAPLTITLNPRPANAQVRLLQYRIIPGRELSFMVDNQVVDPAQPVMIDVSEPSIVRVEVWGADGEPIVLSNQIYIRNLQCDVNNSGRADVADVQLVAAQFNNRVPPVPVRYDLHPDGIIDVRDIIAAGTCWHAGP